MTVEERIADFKEAKIRMKTVLFCGGILIGFFVGSLLMTINTNYDAAFRYKEDHIEMMDKLTDHVFIYSLNDTIVIIQHPKVKSSNVSSQ